MTVRIGRWRSALPCAAVLVLCAMPAFGTATITVDGRYYEFSADATDIYGSVYGPLVTITPSGPGADFNEGAFYDLDSPTFAASAYAYADQVSLLGGSMTFSSLAPSGYVIVQGSAAYDAIDSQAYGESNFELDFSIGVAHDYAFSGTLDKFSSGTTVKALLKEVAGAEIFSTTAEGAFATSGTLAAGEYTLQVMARAFKNVGSSSSYNSTASYDGVFFDLTEVPEPSSLALLALAGLALRRRPSEPRP